MAGFGRTGRCGVRAVLGGVTVGVACWLTAGTAVADETNRGAHNGPRVGLINMGQVDDPAEDVLEHFLLLGDGYRWG